MNIDKLDENRILIALPNSELDTFIENDDDSVCGNSLIMLITLAAVKSGFSLCGRRITITVLDGCECVFLVVSLTLQAALPNGKTKHYSVTFDNADDLLTCALRLSYYLDDISYTRLYYGVNSYTLGIGLYGHGSSLFTAILSEYGKTKLLTSKQAARIEEQSPHSIPCNAVQNILCIQ